MKNYIQLAGRNLFLTFKLVQSSFLRCVFILQLTFLSIMRGFSTQVDLWPINPLDLIIDELGAYLHKRPKILAPLVIADLGCWCKGDLGCRSLHWVLKFIRLIWFRRRIILLQQILQISLWHQIAPTLLFFCLSLMGTNWPDFIGEALRILRERVGCFYFPIFLLYSGFLYIAEVRSRLESRIKRFIDQLQNLGPKIAG